MGPQFTFKTLSDEKLDEERKNVTSSPTAILQPTNDVSELMDLSHLGLNSLLSSPPCYTTSRDKEDMASNPDTEGVDTGQWIILLWNLRIKDTFGAAILSFVGRLSTLQMLIIY